MATVESQMALLKRLNELPDNEAYRLLLFLMHPFYIQLDIVNDDDDRIELEAIINPILSLNESEVKAITEFYFVFSRLDDNRRKLRRELVKSREEKELINRCINAKWEFVYLLHYYDDIYKIGRSRDPKGRLRQVRKEVEWHSKGIAANITLAHVISTPDSIETERILHTYFGDFKHRSYLPESFKLDTQQVSDIKSIKKITPLWYIQGMELYQQRSGCIN